MGSKVPPKIASFTPRLRFLDRDRKDPDLLLGAVLGAAGDLGDLLDYVVALDHFAKHAVFIVEVRGGGRGDKELAAVGIGSGIGHGEDAGLGVLEIGMELVGEFVAGTAASGAFRVATLNHEIGNDPMENGAVVKGLTRLGATGEIHEIGDGAGGLVSEQLHFEGAGSGIEGGKDLVVHLCDCSSVRTVRRVWPQPPACPYWKRMAAFRFTMECSALARFPG